ncbi:MAG: hypothetical protein ACJ798_12810 [Phenylobacterium sp.]
MRIIAFTAAALTATALLASAAAAAAQPASVTVVVGPELQAKAVRTLGVRDVNELAADLQKAVERQTGKSHAYDGARIVLELADAKPNRPTFKQMADQPGLSYESFGIGGARIEGHAIAPDGRMTPLSYSYYEPDIRNARLGGTWSDAHWTIQRFAYRLGRGEVLASR